MSHIPNWPPFRTIVLFALFNNGLSASLEGTSAAPPTTVADQGAEPVQADDGQLVPVVTAIEGAEAKNGTDEDFDFVNLPGYGVIDDANSTANATQFSCYNRRYGYYADVPKSCLMFHLCYPVQEPTTQQILFQRFSFVCSEGSMFDQQHLVCVENGTVSVKCEDAPQYFGTSNDKLIASLHQGGDALARGEEEDAEIGTESSLAGDAVGPANGTTDDEKAAQYGALLESLFG
ncbi:hypothetical protein HDE_13393 [Halotydeus destructor]|nr:hypothetical protein HDE_13393 [Halotydeus destructor]